MNVVVPPDSSHLHLATVAPHADNSVRNADDYSCGPPEPVRMRGSAAQPSAAAAAAGEPAFGAAEVDQVVAGTGCFDRERIRRMVQQCGGSVEQAIELLIEQLGQEEPEEAEGGSGSGSAAAARAELQSAAQGDAQPAEGSTGPKAKHAQQGAAAAAAVEQQQRLGDDAIRLELRPRPGNTGSIQVVLSVPGGDGQRAAEQQHQAAEAAGSALADDPGGGEQRGGKRGSKGVRVKHKPEHPGRNQRCPCGSGKKVKNCCGALRGKRGAAAIGRSTEAEEGDEGAAAVQLQVLHI